MSTTDPAPRKRRSIEPAAKLHLIRVQIDEALRVRLDDLSDRYGVAAGTIAREAIGAGLRSVAERLRRAARQHARTERGERDAEADA